MDEEIKDNDIDEIKTEDETTVNNESDEPESKEEKNIEANAEVVTEHTTKTEQTITDNTPTTPLITPSKKSPKKNIIIFSIIGVILIAGIVFAIIFLLNKKNTVANVTKTTSLVTSIYKPGKDDPKLSTNSITTATWFDHQPISDLELFSGLEAFYGESWDVSMTPKYYLIGTDNGRNIVLANVACMMFCGSGTGIYIFLEDTENNTYDLLAQHSLTAFSDGKYIGPALSSIVSINAEEAYSDIAYQETINVNGATLTNTSSKIDFIYSDFLTYNISILSKYAETNFGDLMLSRSVYSLSSGVESQSFILTRPNGTALYYQLIPKISDDQGIPNVTWDNDIASEGLYRYNGTEGCGTAQSLNILTSGFEDLAQTGTTQSGEAVYEFTNINNPTLLHFYNSYVNTRSQYTTDTIISLEEFINNHGVFMYKDALNRYIIFSSAKYGPSVECGKPVIYLYPTSTTFVSVKVGANVTISEPEYKNGWNVIAKPNGKLIIGDKTYDSLFWEGQGNGNYPIIDRGFVVAQKDLLTTIDSQLKQLGLNDKEASDFKEFWIQKLPTTPYVRLTWLGTNEMNILAPLKVYPKPDTMIRIFLDFEGLNEKVDIPAQKLTSIERKGFTLVEWGGLLVK